MDDDLKPDLAESGDEGPLSPGEAMRREKDTYGDDSAYPNRDDSLDEHAGDE